MTAATNPMLWLANNRNLLRTAILTASSMAAVENQVRALPTARTGAGQAVISGAYSGEEAAAIDVEILDNDIDERLISAPIYTGRGSATLTDIEATGTPQTYTLELRKAGVDATYASVIIEGVTVRAVAAGSAGNSIALTVDRSGLTFTASDFSTLAEIAQAGGGESTGLQGPGFDWDTKPLGANGAIPADAHRVAFGDDHSNIHLAYKQFVAGAWVYHLVPAAARAIPAGTPIYFVTGGREVAVSDGMTTETYPDIVTAYDLLNALKTQSALVTLDGVVANDRTPTGQAARELALRTDAHAEQSTGSGSKYATGFSDVTVGSNAVTELLIATCVAATSNEHPLASLGHERWSVRASLSGDLGIFETGQLIRQTAGRFAARIPVRLPPGYGTPKGRFAVTDISYATRTGAETEPPICPVALSLGPAAVDQTITLEYTLRPTGDCLCDAMPVPRLSGYCLGAITSEEGSVTYQTDTIARVIALRAWFTELVRTNTYLSPGSAPSEEPYITDPEPTDVIGLTDTRTVQGLSAKEIVDLFEKTIAQIDPLEGGSPSLRTDGMDAWDAALSEFQDDVAGFEAVESPRTFALPSTRYQARLEQVLITAGISPLGESDASILQSGDGCWRDWGDAAYWKVVGSVGGGYAPLFTNKPYYSSRLGPGGKFFSTREFGLQLNVKCPEDLKVGDRVTLVISQASWGSTYQVSDELHQPIVGAGAQYLTGGAAGDQVQEWYLSRSVDGPAPVYDFDPGAPAGYAGVTGLSFLLVPGGIPSAKGDKITFATVGGHWRYRVNGGAWNADSPPLPISATPTALVDGLSVAFLAGSARSFVAGDQFRFRALQPWALSQLRVPTLAGWKWDGATATLDIDLGKVLPMDAIGLVHDLPATATLQLDGGLADIGDWSEALPWRAGALWKVFDREARYLRLTLAGAAEGVIYWGWLGQALSTYGAAMTTLRLAYAQDRASTGMLQGGPMLGKTVSADIDWPEGAISEDDAVELTAMADHVKANGDEPVMVIVQRTRDEAPIFGVINQDEIELPDGVGYQGNASKPRRLSARLSLAGVWR